MKRHLTQKNLQSTLTKTLVIALVVGWGLSRSAACPDRARSSEPCPASDVEVSIWAGTTTRLAEAASDAARLAALLPKLATALARHWDGERPIPPAIEAVKAGGAMVGKQLVALALDEVATVGRDALRALAPPSGAEPEPDVTSQPDVECEPQTETAVPCPSV